MKIAFFDSGIGGLTVLAEAMKQLPAEEFIYFADTKNIPYGIKDNESIKNLVLDAIEFLSGKDIKALVVACNTATSVVVKSLREKYDFPIIGMEPAVKPATERNGNHKILVCATDRTLAEDKLISLIKNLKATHRVELLSLQQLVVHAEEFDFHSDVLLNYLNEKLSKYNWDDFDSIVLGCTHFIFFRALIKEILPNHIQILDGNKGTVKRLISLIQPERQKLKRGVEYFKSKSIVSPLYFDHYLRRAQELLKT